MLASIRLHRFRLIELAAQKDGGRCGDPAAANVDERLVISDAESRAVRHRGSR